MMDLGLSSSMWTRLSAALSFVVAADLVVRVMLKVMLMLGLLSRLPPIRSETGWVANLLGSLSIWWLVGL